MPLSAADAFDLLRKAKENDRLAHAYLITGPEGSGKAQLASQLCGLLVSTTGDPLAHADVHTIQPESKSRRIVTDQIRELERNLQMRSGQGGRKVGIIFDADRLQPQASNAFLKTLEEPPAHSHLLLLTALPDQLLETILSRCIEVPLQPSKKAEITDTQQRLLAIMQRMALNETSDLPQVFFLVREFHQLLAEAKSAAQASAEADLKEEEKRYKNIADAKWFEEREEYFKARTEARYVGERTRMLDTLEQWWADVLRIQACEGAEDPSVPLDFPHCGNEAALLATRFTAREALKRAGAIESLREQLRNSGINEQLAVEVAFLRAFGASTS